MMSNFAGALQNRRNKDMATSSEDTPIITLENHLLEISSSRGLAAVDEGRKYTFFV